MMAYRKNFVVAIKHNEKILRELDEVVRLPFGSEYSVLLKNKDSRKAVANLEIDGQDVLDGNGIIVDANTTVELKGFMRGSTVRNKFRFIKKTKQISDYRGDRIDDGLVRVEFWFEKEEELKITPPPQPTCWPQPWGGTQIYYSNNTIGSSLGPDTVLGSSCSNVSANYTAPVKSKSDDNGITVKGSETRQGFVYGSTKTLESTSTVITLKLSGFSANRNKKVRKALSVKTRLTCNTCGKRTKSSAKFCGRCGTFLH